MKMTRSQQMRRASFTALYFAIVQAMVGVMIIRETPVFGIAGLFCSYLGFSDFQTFRQTALEMKAEEENV